MKKFILSIVAILAIITSVSAQDSRNRTVNTIVSDVLAQLPAENATVFEAQMSDLAANAPASIEILASLFQPVEKMANNKFEYAVSGVVRYVCSPGNEKFKDAVVKGLQNAIAKTSDSVAKAFFESELRLLGKFEAPAAAQPSVAELLAKAKTLAKSDKVNERIQSLWLYDDAMGSANASKLISAMKDGDRKYRWSALQIAGKYADNAFFKKLAKTYNGVSSEARNDILYWLGEQKADSQIDFILKQIGTKNNTAEAIAAAGKIGGEKAAKALVDLVGGEWNDAAVSAIERFNGDITENLLDALKGASGDKLNSLVKLASNRHLVDACDQILDLAKGGDAVARKALAGVAGRKDIKPIAQLLDAATGEAQKDFSKALVSSVSSQNPNARFESIVNEMLKSRNKDKFFDAIAASGTNDAVALLGGASISGNDAATKALAGIDNVKAAPYIMLAAAKDESLLKPYVNLVNKYEQNIDSKSQSFIKALALAKSADMKNRIIKDMAKVPTVEIFEALNPCLDDAKTAYQAAKSIDSVLPDIKEFVPYEKIEATAAKAIATLKATGNPDDGYAVNSIEKVLSEIKPFPVSELSAEEKEAGFVMLYNGTDLDNWIGDKQGYQSFNGAINVTANYGGDGNLYTKEEYRNFIYRFEFRFLVPAANNGVGLRGPADGSDAAYNSMCEVQVLDHDNPVYANLRPYQVHGSVYGVIPAKRIVHKPLGEWGCEEIKVVGDHITVTVNGEVVVDGNIREACQGHNVAPDGGANPYTVDHKDHPGMFNERGHISFCGHGRGLQFRNIRILALPD